MCSQNPAKCNFRACNFNQNPTGNVTSRAEREDAHAIHYGQWYTSELINYHMIPCNFNVINKQNAESSHVTLTFCDLRLRLILFLLTNL